jgi:hypothetical protein
MRIGNTAFQDRQGGGRANLVKSDRTQSQIDILGCPVGTDQFYFDEPQTGFLKLASGMTV